MESGNESRIKGWQHLPPLPYEKKQLSEAEQQYFALLMRNSSLHSQDPSRINLASEATNKVELIRLTNYIAMTALQQNNSVKTEEYLKKADLHLEGTDPEAYSEERLLTFNNWGCYFRKAGLLREAHECIKKSLKIAQSISFRDNQSATSGKQTVLYSKFKLLTDSHVNMCAVLSSLGGHREALFHANQAQKYVLKEVSSLTEFSHRTERMNVLGIVKHSKAVQFQYLKKYHEALNQYKQLSTIIQQLDAHTASKQAHPLTKSTRQAIQALEKKLNQKQGIGSVLSVKRQQTLDLPDISKYCSNKSGTQKSYEKSFAPRRPSLVSLKQFVEEGEKQVCEPTRKKAPSHGSLLEPLNNAVVSDENLNPAFLGPKIQQPLKIRPTLHRKFRFFS